LVDDADAASTVGTLEGIVVRDAALDDRPRRSRSDRARRSRSCRRPMKISILAVDGMPEVVAGDDIAALIAAHAPDLRGGDVLVVTSKIVSKAEGRLFDGSRDEAIDAETVRVIARRGDTRIVQTRHGFVMAAAGVDASNVAKGEVVLLPVDSDASAQRIRDGILRLLGVNVGVVVSDTFGRPWRVGVTDAALGFAGVVAFDDLRGTVDPYGNELQVTLTCTVDELAAAADLVKGKLKGVPVAIVRGLEIVLGVGSAATQGISAIVRPAGEDLFSLGTRDVLPARADAAEFADGTVDHTVVARAIHSAKLAAHPVGWDAVRFMVLAAHDVPVELRADADVLATSPTVIVAYLADSPTPADLLAVGAAIENVLIALAIERLASRWLWLPDVGGAAALPGIDQCWPIAVIAAGHPAV
jgi:coenzyme F420-0:L-glutamate ligase/coenzyme F420-1:gamma-L-glutamate ligase